ncbi:MAG: hypothetical protein LC754_10450 [Acidobacteria bacterium]|nr:hypothetical protein [Acidobacteriota bacterium]
MLSSWVATEDEKPRDGESWEEAQCWWARRDLSEMYESHVVVSFTEDPSCNAPRGSRHVEFGYALATGKRLIVVGPIEAIFHALPYVERVDTWEEALALLRDPVVDKRHAGACCRECLAQPDYRDIWNESTGCCCLAPAMRR